MHGVGLSGLGGRSRAPGHLVVGGGQAAANIQNHQNRAGGAGEHTHPTSATRITRITILILVNLVTMVSAGPTILTSSILVTQVVGGGLATTSRLMARCTGSGCRALPVDPVHLVTWWLAAATPPPF